MDNRENIIRKMTAYSCECCQHCLTIEPITDEEDLVDYGEAGISIQSWDCGGSRKPSMWQRLKMAFELIRHGGLHGDHVILNKENMENLITDLQYWIERMGER